MKREFLKNLGLEDEVVNKIMKEHGKTVQGLDETIETYRDKVANLQNDIAEKDKSYNELNNNFNTNKVELEKLQKLDYEGLQKSVQDWEDKYNQREYDLKVDKFMEGYKFTSDLAKEATIAKFREQKFKVEKDGKLSGADEYMKKFVEDNKNAFVLDDEGSKDPDSILANLNNQNNKQKPYMYKPSGGNNADDTKSFEAMLDNIAKM